jgi:ABC-type multidrug transport system fused ATPase/permease subunit
MILLLDQATSALSSFKMRWTKRKQVEQRLSTIRHTDLIIGFDQGQMMEELINLKGLD